jgi:hypothetical protein
MRLAPAAALALAVLAGCSDGDGDGGQRGAPGQPSAEAVVRGWADDLREGDVEGATDRFAVPAIVANNTPQIRLDTRAEVRHFNATLPCGGRVTDIVRHHGVLITTFVLTDRPGGDCGAGVGGIARTAFEVRDGHIVRWLRLPDSGDTGPPGARET